MTALWQHLLAWTAIPALLVFGVWRVRSILAEGAPAGRHRLDRVPVHQGYADDTSKLAELTEARGRHAA